MQANNTLPQSHRITQAELQQILKTQNDLVELQRRLSLAETRIARAIEAGIPVERGQLKAILEDKWNPRDARIDTYISICSTLPLEKSPSERLRERAKAIVRGRETWTLIKSTLPEYLLIAGLVAWFVVTAVLLGLAGLP